jgi:hypothetical protein
VSVGRVMFCLSRIRSPWVSLDVIRSVLTAIYDDNEVTSGSPTNPRNTSFIPVSPSSAFNSLVSKLI